MVVTMAMAMAMAITVVNGHDDDDNYYYNIGSLSNYNDDHNDEFKKTIECFHSRGQHLCRFIGTKESVCMRKEFNSQRIDLGHQHGRRDVM